MNIIVTGASRGIGFETAFELSKDKNNLVIAVSRSKEKLEVLRNKCLDNNGIPNLIPLQFDLQDIHKTGDFLIEALKKHFTSVDILVNNAGFLLKKPFMDLTKDDYQNMFDTNFYAPSHLVRLLIPMMDKSGGHIVNIGSMGGFQGSAKFSGLSYYSASKAALSTLTECLSEEFKDSKIKFNCLAIGSVQTEMLSEAFPGYKAPIKASEMGKFVADFALGAHKFMNGKIVPVSSTNP